MDRVLAKGYLILSYPNGVADGYLPVLNHPGAVFYAPTVCV